jgi:hypothetical protein
MSGKCRFRVGESWDLKTENGRDDTYSFRPWIHMNN